MASFSKFLNKYHSESGELDFDVQVPLQTQMGKPVLRTKLHV